MSHTPGPWSLERDCNNVPEFVFGGDTCVCDFGIEAPKPEDARLIAAAPELLETLEAVIRTINTPEAPDAELARERAQLLLAELGHGTHKDEQGQEASA